MVIMRVKYTTTLEIYLAVVVQEASKENCKNAINDIASILRLVVHK